MRTAMRLLTVLCVLAASLLAPVLTGTPAQQAGAADLRHFDPGNIISDAVFFDGLAMDAPAIQAFLDDKGAACRIGTDGSPCLKDYAMTTTSRAGDGLCAGYSGAAKESAARIIAKVAASCGVSPRVLLVLLEKEMGFVRTTNPTAKKYDRAAGYACPDNVGGWCNPEYAGLQNQLYRSAWQYQRYAANASSYSYRAGRNNLVQWHPNAACGTSVVYIANQATAGLYNYTPYRPNQAALNAGYGTGDSCSSYGNRNFWNFFTDWFGSTQSTGGGAILAKYRSLGGDGGPLGAPTSPYYCGLVQQGCYQVFTHGSIYWSPASGAWSTSEVTQAKWGTIGLEWGVLGYPVSDPVCGLRDDGCFQVFQKGSIYSSPASGAHAVRAAMRNKWQALGWELSSLGYPLMDESCGLVGNGCYQAFQGGTLYWSPATGARFVSGAIRDRWSTMGNEWGPLGYPTGDTRCGLVGDGCYQRFQYGSLYSSPATGTRFVTGAVARQWQAQEAENGPLGYPLTDERCGLVDNGCYQLFQGGSLYWSPATGARSVTGEVRERWGSLRYERGILGWPVRNTRCGLVDSGCYQEFEHGALYWSPDTGAYFVRGGIRSAWARTGNEWGELGYPVTDEHCGLRDGGCFQHYARGSVYWTPAIGAHPVSGPIRDAWAAERYEVGPWGYPVAGPTSSAGDTVQRFQRGTATFTAATGKVTFAR